MARYIDLEILERRIKKYVKPEIPEEKAFVEWCKDECIRQAYAMPTADVVPKSEEGAECPTCHGTGRIGTTDWLTKGISKKKLAEEKAKAIAEHEQHIKTEVAREIFEEIYKSVASKIPMQIRPIFKGDLGFDAGFINGKREALLDVLVIIAELKKKYTQN